MCFELVVNMYKHDEINLEDDSLGSKLTAMDETIKITVSESPSPGSQPHSYEHSSFGGLEAVREVKDVVDSSIGELVVGEIELATLSNDVYHSLATKTPGSAVELVMSENAKEEAKLQTGKVNVEKFSPVAKTLSLRKVIRERSERNLSRDTIVEGFIPPPRSEEKEDIPLPSAVIIPKKMLSPVATKQLRHLKPEYKMITAAAAVTKPIGEGDRPLTLDYEPSTLRTLEHAVVATGGVSLPKKKREVDVCGTSLPFGFCNSQGDESPTITAVVAREKEKKLPKTTSCVIS